MMKWNIRKNQKFLPLLLTLCALVPHAVLAIIRAKVNAETIVPFRAESIALFMVCEWTPFWAVYLAHLRQQKMDDFSVLPMCGFLPILVSYLPVCDRKCISVLLLTLPLLMILECLSLLKKWERAKSPWLRGMAANRKLLRVFFFWSVAIVCIIRIACAPFHATTVNPLILLPVPAILVACGFRALDVQAPTRGAVVGLLVLLTVSLVLVASGPMAHYRLYNIAIVLSGYGCFFLLQLIYHMDYWRKAGTVQ